MPQIEQGVAGCSRSPPEKANTHDPRGDRPNGLRKIPITLSHAAADNAVPVADWPAEIKVGRVDILAVCFCNHATPQTGLACAESNGITCKPAFGESDVRH